MAIGRTWEECLQKAMRMVDPGIEGFQPKAKGFENRDKLIYELTNPSDKRLYAIAQVSINITRRILFFNINNIFF